MIVDNIQKDFGLDLSYSPQDSTRIVTRRCGLHVVYSFLVSLSTVVKVYGLVNQSMYTLGESSSLPCHASNALCIGLCAYD